MARTPVVKYALAAPSGFDVPGFARLVENRLTRYVLLTDTGVLTPTTGGTSRIAGVVAFADGGEAGNFEEWMAGRLGQTGGPTGRVMFHECSHAFGEPATEPCSDPVTQLRVRTG